jgi:hypothetical protein
LARLVREMLTSGWREHKMKRLIALVVFLAGATVAVLPPLHAEEKVVIVHHRRHRRHHKVVVVEHH